MSTSLHTFGWTDPATLEPENGVQLFCVGWLRVIPAEDGVFPMGSPPGLNRRILRDDDETTVVAIMAFMEIRDRWH